MDFKNSSLREHVTKILSKNLVDISASLKFLLFNSFQEVAKNAQQTLLKLVNACDSPLSSKTASIELLRKSKVLSDSAGLVYLLIFDLESQARKENIPKDKLAGNWLLDICEKLEEDLENGDLVTDVNIICEHRNQFAIFSQFVYFAFFFFKFAIFEINISYF